MSETRIKVRSPYYIKYSDTNLNYVELDISIYTGNKLPPPSTFQYSLKKYETGIDNYVVFEISELVRDYIETEFDGTYDNEPVWVRLGAKLYESDGTQIGSGYTNNYYLAFDGYTLFEEGINYTTDTPVFITDRVDTPTSEVTIYRPSDEVIRIPVNVDNTDGNDGGWFFKLIEPDNDETQTSVSNSSNTDDQIYYISVGTQYNKVELWKEPSGMGLETKVYTIHIENLNCTKHESVKVTFYNRWGALQDLYFTGKTIESINVTGEEYKANVIDFSTLTYNVAKHQYNQYDKQGKRTIQLSTGYVNEDYNAWIEELMLSEKVWITLDGTLYPATPKTSSQTFKTRLNDSLVAYTIDFDFAFDQIQNIR